MHTRGVFDRKIKPSLRNELEARLSFRGTDPGNCTSFRPISVRIANRYIHCAYF